MMRGQLHMVVEGAPSLSLTPPVGASAQQGRCFMHSSARGLRGGHDFTCGPVEDDLTLEASLVHPSDVRAHELSTGA